MADDNDGFLSRWSRRKAQVQRGLPPADPALAPAAAPAAPAPAPAPAPVAAAPAVPAPAAPPPPTLDDVALLTPDADFSRFVAPQVDGEVKNAALKKLFADPHFNVMDGLDTYIDDYGKPDPLPAGMLRQMAQSRLLGLFDDDPDATPTPTPPAATLPADPSPLPLPDTVPDEDPDLRLQPDDDAGRAGAHAGPGEDPGRQH